MVLLELPPRGGPEPRSATRARHRAVAGLSAQPQSLSGRLWCCARARRRRNGACTAQLGAIREGSVHTLHRSHACPVRFESASFLFTEPEKSLLLLRRWCGLVDWMPWCVCEMPWPCCSIRWILLMLARLASSSDMRFVPDAMIDASAVSSELRLTREQPGC